MLKITGDGRKAALDMRLVTGQPASAPGKLQAAAANIARLYHATRDREYLDPRHRPAVTDTAARCRSCSATSPHPDGRGGTPTISSATSSSTAASPPTGSATSTRPATTSRRPACSRPAAPGRSA